MSGANFRVALVVDDSPMLRSLLRATVRPLGFEVVEAEDGAAGLAQLRSRRVDLIITDCAMPGMDGLDFIRAVRSDEKLRDLPLVMMTAQEDPEERILALEAGADAFLRKDVPPSVVRRCIQALLRPGAPGPFHRGGAFGGLAQAGSLARALLVGLGGPFVNGLSSRLLERGFAVVESNSPEEALEWLDSAGPVEVCLVDGDMPADGALQFVRRIREIPRLEETRIVVILESPEAPQVAAAGREGADDCVPQSLGPDEVIRRILALLNPGTTS